jgi:mannose-6-phosphate isomerase-like protein (cupin superfamily)
MHTYPKLPKKRPNCSYWGEYDEIELGISEGKMDETGPFNDPLHYHKEGTVFFLCLEGKGEIEVEGKIASLEKDVLLEIKPKEKYRVTRSLITPFHFIVMCTRNTESDKIVVQ